MSEVGNTSAKKVDKIASRTWAYSGCDDVGEIFGNYYTRGAAIPNTPVKSPMMIATAIPTTINIFRFAIIIRIFILINAESPFWRCRPVPIV
jgi:hypothetical protein